MKIQIGKKYNIRGEYNIVHTVSVVRKSWVPFRYFCAWEVVTLSKRTTMEAGYIWSWQFIAEVK